MSERLAQGLCLRTLDRLTSRSKVVEVEGEGGGYFRPYVNERSGQPVGELRIWIGDGPVKKIVYAGIKATVPGVIDLDSHMIYAFTEPGSPVPHFTLDSVERKDLDTHAFHLDFTPKVDLGTHIKYTDEVYEPVLEAWKQVKNLTGISEAELLPRQRSIMSPYMCAYRATPDAYRQLDDPVNVYLDHWFNMVENGLSAATVAEVSDTDIADRDAKNRGLIFNAEVDPVWHHIIPLIGAENSELNRVNLEKNELITEVSV
jgi:hypothetical protein